MRLDEYLYFTRTFRGDATNVASIIPTSHFAARALTSECARDPKPKRILEAGPGTGAVTAELVKLLGPQDKLTLVELNPDFANYLRDRFERDPEFARVRDRVEIREMSITDVEGSARYDYIVSAIPFSNLPPEIVSAILLRFRALLKPGGVLSFIEYAYGRAAKRAAAKLMKDHATLEKAESVEKLVAAQAETHEFRRDTVLRNVPPAWVRHWRFDDADAHIAETLLPREHTQRVALGNFAFDTDAVPAVAALGALAWLTRKRAPAIAGLATIAAAGAALLLRDPKRNVLADADLVSSACDGEVLSVEEISDARFGEAPWLRIACFLSLADVHINRAPLAGRVVETRHEPGSYAAAMLEDAEHNAAVYTVIETAAGQRYIVAQRVGAVARRIVNRCKAGDIVAKGEKIGLIRMGSRVDVYLPAGKFETLVNKGDRLVAGETPIARRLA